MTVMIKKSLILLILIGLIACATIPEIIEIEFEKNIIPEGIAMDFTSKKIYLSSVHQHKIIEYDLYNKKAENFIESGDFGYGIGVGLMVKDGRLFALCSKQKNGLTQSSLHVFQIADKIILHSYTFQDSLSYFMNDLAISRTNQIYISDTERHRIYHLDYPNGEIKIFKEDPQIQYPNGITISDDGTKLFVDSWTNGIRIIDISTNQIINTRNVASSEIGIDGLKYYNGHLYAIKNGSKDKSQHGLIKIALNESETDIQKISPLLLDHQYFNIPTTFCIHQGEIFMIANSQMDNLNQETNVIIAPEKLTNTIILRHKLN